MTCLLNPFTAVIILALTAGCAALRSEPAMAPSNNGRWTNCLGMSPNVYGLYDLAGNAMEWCDDRYDTGHEQRVLRGGAWINCGPRSLWSSARNHAAPGKFSVATGFRCVLAGNP